MLHGQEVETTATGPRFYLARREPGVYPTAEEMYVTAPALADEKARPGFDQRWASGLSVGLVAA